MPNACPFTYEVAVWKQWLARGLLLEDLVAIGNPVCAKYEIITDEKIFVNLKNNKNVSQNLNFLSLFFFFFFEGWEGVGWGRGNP